MTGGLCSHSYFGGLPSFVKNMPRKAAAFRSMPAFFIASRRSGPGGASRASSSAANARACKSWSGGSSFCPETSS
jgi:hypothetical protein